MIRDKVYMTYKIDKLIKTARHKEESPERSNLQGKLNKITGILPKIDEKQEKRNVYWTKHAQLIDVSMYDNQAQHSLPNLEKKIITVCGASKTRRLILDNNSTINLSKDCDSSSLDLPSDRVKVGARDLLQIRNIKVNDKDLIPPFAMLTHQKFTLSVPEQVQLKQIIQRDQQYISMIKEDQPKRCYLSKSTQKKNEMKNKVKELSDNLLKLEETPRRTLQMWSFNRNSNEDLCKYIAQLRGSPKSPSKQACVLEYIKPYIT